MGLLTTGIAWLAGQLAEHAGDEAVYQGDGDSITLTVVSQGDGGDGEYVQRLGDTPEDTVYVSYPPEQGYCGFLVRREQLVLNGVSALPRRGHKIIIGGREFRVSSPDGTLPWKYHPNPASRVWYWIHTKLNEA